MSGSAVELVAPPVRSETCAICAAVSTWGVMKKRTVILLLGALSSLAPLAAYAGDSVDCAGVAHWNSDHHYNKGDRAWYLGLGGDDYKLYSCEQDKCSGVGANEPGSDSKIWRLLGHCAKSPS